jgi:hypothetical protein
MDLKQIATTTKVPYDVVRGMYNSPVSQLDKMVVDMESMVQKAPTEQNQARLSQAKQTVSLIKELKEADKLANQKASGIFVKGNLI